MQRTYRTDARIRTNRFGLPTAVLAAIMALLSCGCTPFVPLTGAAGCNVTPANSFWRTDVRGLPVHSQSAKWIGIAGGGKLKADMGSFWEEGPIGIPYDTVAGDRPKINIAMEYDDSDLAPYPNPTGMQIEGGSNSSGDRHIIMVDRDNCRLYELFSAYPAGNGWRAGSGAQWDMRSNAMRKLGNTSADAAGLQILPGLVRYEEVKAGKVPHAIRMTVSGTLGHVWPASHTAGSKPNAMPLGAWLRLKPSVNENSFDPYVRPIIVALKTHGAVVADNGSSWYITGSHHPDWDDDKLHELGRIGPNDFEVVNAEGVMVSNTSYESKLAG